MTEQEKLDILSSDFNKLDENKKDYILELSKKLADIHCGERTPVEYNGNDLKQGEISGIIRLEPVLRHMP
jgi:hypothetical protein